MPQPGQRERTFEGDIGYFEAEVQLAASLIIQYLRRRSAEQIKACKTLTRSAAGCVEAGGTWTFRVLFSMCF